jgi:hypothetical protein
MDLWQDNSLIILSIVIMPNVLLMSVVHAECRYGKCHNVKCHYAECCRTLKIHGHPLINLFRDQYNEAFYCCN